MGCTLKSTLPNNLCLCAFLALPRLVNGMLEIVALYKWRFLQSVIALGRVKGNNDLCVSCKLNLCLCECVVKRKGKKTTLQLLTNSYSHSSFWLNLGSSTVFGTGYHPYPYPPFTIQMLLGRKPHTKITGCWPVLTYTPPFLHKNPSMKRTEQLYPYRSHQGLFAFNLRVESKGRVPHWLQTLRGKLKHSVLNLDKAPLVAKMLRISRLGEITLVTPCI